MNSILIVEDDFDLNQIMCKFLKSKGYQVTGCYRALQAFDLLQDEPFDLIISDIMMPEIDGYEFLRSVREINELIPVLFVSARDDIASKQRGFSLGIDDYMTKPVDFDELEMRIGALLRRSNIKRERKIDLDGFVVDFEATSLTYQGEDIPVTLREFKVLYKLLSNPNRTFSRSQLMDEFWGVDSESSLRSVDVYITKLRDKCSVSDAFTIKTIHGLGYKVVLK